MTIEYKKIEDFHPSENNHYDPLKDVYNQNKMRTWFRKLSEIYIDIANYENPKEFQEKSNMLITFLLAPYERIPFFDFKDTQITSFKEAPIDVKRAMFKEFL